GDRYRANQTLMQQSDKVVYELETGIRKLTEAEASLRVHTRTCDQITDRLETIQRMVIDWESNDIPRLAEIQGCLSGESFAPEARIKLAEIDAELKVIGYDAAAHDLTRRLEMDGRVWEGEVRALEKARAALGPLMRELSEIGTQIEAQRVDVDRQRDEYDRAASALAAAMASAPDLDEAERQSLRLKEQENIMRIEVGGARQKVLILDDLKARLKVYNAEREQKARQAGYYKQLERAFGKDGVPSLLIEQALPQIEAKANEILDRLTGGNMSVRFVTQAAYKDKRREDLKETLDIQISDGAGTRDYEMFSGGEAFRVNFAIRLALSEVLAQRAGARLQTLVIDEGFGSQDVEGRQRLLEANNMVSQDFAKILVITHIDELKDAFPNRVEVEKTPRGSIVRVI
ncbi:MAG: SMC family ATPase, partial [Chloroflexota bacterium]